MGNVYTKLTLKNSGDLTNVDRGIITKNKVRSTTVTALVDTGATTLIINEKICKKLGLSILKPHTVSLAGGQKSSCKITEPVRIIWKDRDTDCRAWVLPGDDDPLLGVIPLEDMDLMVDPRRKELKGVHGDVMMGQVK